jgi:hypothetical protein
MGKYLRVAMAACLAVSWSSLAPALDEVSVGELSYLDRQYMAGQRSALDELAGGHFGTRFKGDRAHDLRLMQRLLDAKVVRSDQTRELQAMGILLGDLLARELDMHWVVYEDKLGRSRALRYRDTDLYLFPVTMISRRWEGGAYTPVADIYQKAVDTISPALPTLPFQ